MPRKSPSLAAPAECPVCGAEVPRGARACPSCGADEKTGWDEEKTRYDGLDLPDEAFDYGDALKEEGLRTRVIPKGLSPRWWLAGVVVLIVVIVLVALRRF